MRQRGRRPGSAREGGHAPTTRGGVESGRPAVTGKASLSGGQGAPGRRAAVSSAARKTGSGVTLWLGQVGDFLIHVARIISNSVVRPVANKIRTLRNKVSARFKDHLVDSDTYDPSKARDWERFHKGKRSSSYLQDDDKRR